MERVIGFEPTTSGGASSPQSWQCLFSGKGNWGAPPQTPRQRHRANINRPFKPKHRREMSERFAD
jgi:hypothetical protein